MDVGRDPYFAGVKGLTPVEAYEKLLKNIRTACEHHQGAPNVAEFVFPSMIHLFAEAGMIPAPKVCKESFNPHVLATAMGAALQYDRELWACCDLWGVVPFWGTRHQDAGHANPAHSITYVQLAAALTRLGRFDEARAAAAKVLELQPSFRYSRQFAGVDCAPALAASMGDALRTVGLPE